MTNTVFRREEVSPEPFYEVDIPLTDRTEQKYVRVYRCWTDSGALKWRFDIPLNRQQIYKLEVDKMELIDRISILAMYYLEDSRGITGRHELINMLMNIAKLGHEKALASLLVYNETLPDNEQIPTADLDQAAKETARYGNVAALELLVSKDRVPIAYLGEAVIQAVQYGNVAALELLVSKDRVPIAYLGEAVIQAVQYGNVAALELLVSKGRVPIAYLGEAVIQAVQHGHVAALELLVSNGRRGGPEYLSDAMNEAMARNDVVSLAILLFHDKSGPDPIANESLVSFLSANPEISDQQVSEAISWAMHHERIEALSVLVSFLHMPVDCLGAALVMAAEYNHIQALRLLVSRGLQSVCLGAYSMELWVSWIEVARRWAIENNGFEAFVMLLFSDGSERDDQCVHQLTRFLSEGSEIPSDSLLKAMVWVVQEGHISAFPLFLSDNRISHDFLGAALVAAVGAGQMEIVNLLLRDDRISHDFLGEALEAAAGAGQMEIMNILLRDDRISYDFLGAALVVAAGAGQMEIVNLLLRRYRISRDCIDKAREAATGVGQIGIVRLLL